VAAGGESGREVWTMHLIAATSDEEQQDEDD
jgi:hypothetical protein